GGARTLTGLEDPGTVTSDRHARDADTILGDNGTITRIVVAGNQFARFTYDNYDATRWVIPRVVQLLDYSPLGEPYYTADPAVTGNPSPQFTMLVNAAVTNIGGG